MKRKLFTIGYTGFSIPEFIDKLTANGIECLIDTREIPISRKKGFAKTALGEHLLEAGIAYRHFRLLGSAKSVNPGTVILHSRADEVVPFADSEELIRNSGLPASSLIEVGNDHRLADREPLEAMLKVCSF